MCTTVKEPKEQLFCFDTEQLDAELFLFRKRMEKLLKKVERNESTIAFLDKGYNFQQFKESIRENNENLKK